MNVGMFCRKVHIALDFGSLLKCFPEMRAKSGLVRELLVLYQLKTIQDGLKNFSQKT
jgi:hypothetical protein